MYLNYVTDPKISRNFHRSIIGQHWDCGLTNENKGSSGLQPARLIVNAYRRVCPPQPKKIDSPGGRGGSNMEGPSKAEAFVVRSSTSTYPLGGATSLLPGPVNLGSMAI
ncbi:hypothetical protein V1477_018758 [Vespula maculifrons]|uniref:Uncharacterized protein n=1 Tax=Vespula maculifrons TaxID=7453 RepID=A0ABD2AX60_VESMC